MFIAMNDPTNSNKIDCNRIIISKKIMLDAQPGMASSVNNRIAKTTRIKNKFRLEPNDTAMSKRLNTMSLKTEMFPKP